MAKTIEALRAAHGSDIDSAHEEIGSLQQGQKDQAVELLNAVAG